MAEWLVIRAGRKRDPTRSQLKSGGVGCSGEDVSSMCIQRKGPLCQATHARISERRFTKSNRYAASCFRHSYIIIDLSKILLYTKQLKQRLVIYTTFYIF